MKKLALYKCFNPRTHTGCDTDFTPNLVSCITFQSTHPHGVRLVFWLRGGTATYSFNPRTHTGCDLINRPVKLIILVSIHAPTRGATLSPSSTVPLALPFQSTHPHGVRQRSILFSRQLRGVSIHAPTRGATRHKSFPSTPFEFQSTHPHGVRRLHRHSPLHCLRFNPRTHTGCDPDPVADPPFTVTFQSTHPHGVRRSARLSSSTSYEFQSTHPHGVRRNVTQTT